MAVQERGIRTRNELVRAAAVVFDTNGFTGGSTSMILKATNGVVQGSLYFHFPTKRHIAVAVLEESRDRVSGLLAGIAAKGGPALGAIIEFSAAYTALLADDVMARAGYRLTMEPSPLSGDASDAIVAMMKSLDVLMQRASTEGDLRSDVIAEAAGRLVAQQFVGVQQLDEIANHREQAARHLAASWQLLLPGLVPDDRLEANLARCRAAFEN